MSWAPIPNTSPPKKPGSNTFEISSQYVDEQGRAAQRTYSRNLCRVRMPENYRYKKWRIKNSDLDVYNLIVNRFSYQLVSYQSIKRMAPGIKPRTLSHHLSVLWAQGYLEKFARGEYGAGLRGKYAGKVGKYHGVYYRAIQI